jgi:hypothetical protein
MFLGVFQSESSQLERRRYGKVQGHQSGIHLASKRTAKPAEEVTSVYYCQVLKLSILDDEEHKMGCKNLLDLPWNSVRDKWLTEVLTWTPPEEFPGTIRANPDLWKEDLIVDIFGITKEEKVRH